MGIGDEKWQLDDVHDVDGQMDVAMGSKDFMRNWSDVADDVRRHMICCLSFEGAEIGTKDAFGRLNMLLVDGAVVNVMDGDVHEFSTARTDDDVLDMLFKNGIFVFSFGKLFGIASHSGNHGPKVIDRLIML
jgi:hypothetical protein